MGKNTGSPVSRTRNQMSWTEWRNLKKQFDKDLNSSEIGRNNQLHICRMWKNALGIDLQDYTWKVTISWKVNTTSNAVAQHKKWTPHQDVWNQRLLPPALLPPHWVLGPLSVHVLPSSDGAFLSGIMSSWHLAPSGISCTKVCRRQPEVWSTENLFESLHAS